MSDEDNGKREIIGKALGPAATEFGKTVAPLGKEAAHVTVRAIRLGLHVVSEMIWSFEAIGAYLIPSLAEKLKDVPPEKIVEANPRVSVPAIEAMRYSSNEREIREIFTNLIAADLVNDTKPSAHPSFVEIVKQMSVTDAKILREIAEDGSRATIFSVRLFQNDAKAGQYKRIGLHTPLGGDHAQFDEVMVAVSSLERLGLIKSADGSYPANAIERHNAYKAGDHYKKSLASLNEIADRVEEHHTGIWLTRLGRAFVDVCL